MSSAPARDLDSTAVSGPASDDIDAPLLSWSVHLLRQRPRALGRIAACAAIVLACGLALFHTLWLALLPAAALLLSVSEYLFPTHYALTRQGARSRCGLLVLEMSWRDVKHAYLAEDGVKLSPLAAVNSRFEGMRGIFLRFDGGNRDVVIDLVRQLRAQSGE